MHVVYFEARLRGHLSNRCLLCGSASPAWGLPLPYRRFLDAAVYTPAPHHSLSPTTDREQVRLMHIPACIHTHIFICIAIYPLYLSIHAYLFAQPYVYYFSLSPYYMYVYPSIPPPYQSI